MSLLVLLHVLNLVSAQDTLPSSAALQRLALRGSDPSLAVAVRISPVAARDALVQLLTQASRADPPGPALAASARLAHSLASEVGDTFAVRQVTRFNSWSVVERRQKVAIDSLRRAGNAALNRDGFPAAQALWRESIRRAQLLGDTAGVGAATGNLGAGWYAERELDSAASYFQRAADLAGSVGDQRTALNALGGLANVRRDRGDLAGARALYDETSRRRDRISDVRGLVADLTNSGVLAEQLGDLAGAQRSYSEAVIQSLRYGLDEAEAAARVNLGQLAALKGDFVVAEREYRWALATYKRLGFRADEALVLQGLGLMELRRGNYTGASARLGEAALIYRATGPAEAQVGVQFALASVSVATGHPEEARHRVEAAADIAQRSSSNPRLQARVALARADLEAAFNSRTAAERWYEQAEAAYRRAGDDAGMAQARAGRGNLLLGDQDYAGARALLQQAVRTEEQLGDVRSAALAKLDLATALSGSDQPGGAQALAVAARDTLARLGDGPGQAAAIALLAQLDLDAGRPASAEALYRAALAALDEPADLGVRWPLQLGLARALASQGARGTASGILEQAVAEVEASASDLTTDRRSAWLADKWELYSALALIDAADGRDSAAFATAERLRARELLEQVGRGRIAWRPDNDSALVRQEQDLRRAVTQLAGALDGPSFMSGQLRGPDPRNASGAAEREALAEAEGRYAALLEQVRDREPAYASTIRPRHVSWRVVASHLPPDAVLLDYLVTDSTTLLFVVTPERMQALDLGVDRRTLASLVDFVRGALAQAPREGTPDPGAAALERLHAILIGPAERAGLLDGTRRLLIVPHGELHYLPFAALKESGERGRPLVMRFDIALVPSASFWVDLEARPEPRGQGVLAVAPASVRLPGSLAEVRAIGAAYGPQAQMLTGAAASREEILRRAPDVSVLHIASYGVLNRRNPLFSYVELGPAGSADGRLEVHDVFGMGLDARLVVLSACQTGVGSGLLADVPAGDEWVSLSRAFLVAGARRVVASLWLVEDRTTADLMAAFHRDLARGATISAALGAAQRAIMAQPGRAHPFYWAGFEVVGGF